MTAKGSPGKDQLFSRQGSSANPLLWAFANFGMAVILSIDINYGSLSRFLPQDLVVLNAPVKYIEIGLSILFGWNTFFDVILYVWPMVSRRPVRETLFGGYELVEPKDNSQPAPETPSTPPNRNKFINLVTPSSYTGSPALTSTPCTSRLPNHSLDSSSASWLHSSFTSSPNLSLTSSSWNFVPGQASPIFPSSRDSSFHHMAETPESLRMRKTPLNSSLASQADSRVIEEKSIENYIKELESPEHKSDHIKFDHQSSFNYFTNLGNTSSGLLSKYQYLPACRSPQSSTAMADDPDFPATNSGEMIWSKFDISESQLTFWNENLRLWLSQTILLPLVAEINNINDILCRLGSPDLQIGEVSHSSLRQVVLTKAQHVPTLTTLIPYLEIGNNQEYLVQRIRDLAKGGCMSEFRWNSGGQFKGKQWTDELPTDCAVIMHLLCSYLDSRLPPNPMYPDGKTFTSQYFKKTPDKPSVSKDSLCIFQSRINPPHFRLVIEEETWDISKGRSNIFNTILLFLHHVRTAHCGMLGRINLGPSGVNILWVVES